jgi:DNA-binding transcriptional LysR family regulator
VSAAIACLEAAYGVKLFHRIGRQIDITEAGKFLQVEAQKILEQVTLAERGLRELNDLQRGELRIGSSLTIGNYWLPAKISKFQELYPNIVVNCTLANTEEICLGTATGKFDLGLIEGEVKPSLVNSLEEESIGCDRLQIIVGRSHGWFSKGEVYLEDLTETYWIMREAGSGTQQRFEEALMSWGINLNQLKIILILNTGEMVKAVVENGIAAAGISELMVQKELKIGTLKTIQVIPKKGKQPLECVRHFLKIKHRQRFQTQIAKAFESLLIP